MTLCWSGRTKQSQLGLLDAQVKAQGRFAEIESRGIIRAGATEKEINENVYALAEELYGVTRHWHKRIVPAGRNTLAPATSTRNLIPKTGSN